MQYIRFWRFGAVNMTKFKKDSKDKKAKPMFSLIDPYWQLELAEILTFGATKYGLKNWQSASMKELRHYEDALYRHMNQYQRGIMRDEDTNRSHLSHVAVNAMFLHFFWRRYDWSTSRI